MFVFLLLLITAKTDKFEIEGCLNSKATRKNKDIARFIYGITTTMEYKNISEIDEAISTVYEKRPVKVCAIDLKIPGLKEFALSEISTQNKIKATKYSKKIIFCSKIEDTLFMVYEDWKTNLLKKYARICKMNIYRKLEVMQNMALALKSLHDNGIVHGDVRLIHFYFSNKGIILGDYYHSSSESADKAYTGWNHYRAPELNVMNVPSHQNFKSDIWMLTVAFVSLFSEKSIVNLWNKINKKKDSACLPIDIYERFITEATTEIFNNERIPYDVSKTITLWLSIKPNKRPTLENIISDIRSIILKKGKKKILSLKPSIAEIKYAKKSPESNLNQKKEQNI